MKKNIITGAESENWPNVIGATINATPEQAQAAGWRDVPPQPPLEAGYTRVSSTFGEGDGVTGAWDVTDRLTEDIEAEAAAAKRAAMAAQLTPGLVAMASAYRAALRALFGDGAEVNHAVTKEAVAGAMLQLPAAQYDAKTADMLKLAFEELSAITGDGTTWTLFETAGDLIP
jgi:hypothetical protein